MSFTQTLLTSSTLEFAIKQKTLWTTFNDDK